MPGTPATASSQPANTDKLDSAAAVVAPADAALRVAELVLVGSSEECSAGWRKVSK